MSELRDLLIELGTEELPPKALRKLATAFANEVHLGLERQTLEHSSHHWYATPRRLVVLIKNLSIQQADREEIRRGPALSAAYDAAGKPTKAVEGFAGSCNTRVSDLETLETDKGSWLIFRSAQKGKKTTSLIPEIIETALTRLPIPKRMRWGDGDAEFVRPVHWSLVLFGNETVKCQLLGTVSGNETRGHRFLNPKPIKLNSSADYLATLKQKGFVIADYEKRKQQIEKAVARTAEKLEGRALIDPDLLEEVTSLVEWPVIINGTFEKKFLGLPREVLVATMQDHQKYFPVTNKSGSKLLNYFITVMNIKSKSPKEVVHGNERVIRPRLADAAFFWQRDCSRKLEDLIPNLKDVVFEKELGTLDDKTQRVKKLAGYIAGQLGCDKKLAERAAELSKCDLFTEMVGEFPELQGIMGRYYALESNENQEVAQALDEQYMPRFAGDDLPSTKTGQILAIADKLDTLAGLFGIGQQPTGDKDPYGLRRATLGIIRIVIEKNIFIPLNELVNAAFDVFSGNIGDAHSDLIIYIHDRLAVYMKEKGYSTQEVDSVMCLGPLRINLVPAQLKAVRAFSKLPEAISLVAANKRVVNILKQAEASGEAFGNATIDDMKEPIEKKLHEALEITSKQASAFLKEGNFTDYLKSFAKLKEPIDDFFDSVMVMVEDAETRKNRLALLKDIRMAMNKVADISRLQS